MSKCIHIAVPLCVAKICNCGAIQHVKCIYKSSGVYAMMCVYAMMTEADSAEAGSVSRNIII